MLGRRSMQVASTQTRTQQFIMRARASSDTQRAISCVQVNGSAYRIVAAVVDLLALRVQHHRRPGPWHFAQQHELESSNLEAKGYRSGRSFCPGRTAAAAQCAAQHNGQQQHSSMVERCAGPRRANASGIEHAHLCAAQLVPLLVRHVVSRGSHLAVLIKANQHRTQQLPSRSTDSFTEN